MSRLLPSRSVLARRRPVSGLGVWMLVVLVGGHAVAQTDLTTTLIEERLSALREAGADAQDEMVLAYDAAQDFLVAGEAHRQAEAALVEGADSAPERQAEIEARLDALEAEPDPIAALDDLSDAELEARLPTVRSDLRDANERLSGLDQRLAARETNVASARERIAEIAQRIGELPDGALTVDPRAAPSLLEAVAWRDAAERAALAAERRTLEAQLETQPARFGVLAVERAELAARSTRLSDVLRELETRTATILVEAVDPGSLGIDPSGPAHEVAVEMADADAEVGQERVELAARMTEVRTDIEQIAGQARALEERFATARRVVEFASGSDALGQVLLAYWAELETYVVPDPSNELSREAGSAVIRRIEHEEALGELVSSAAYVNRRLEAAGLEPAAIDGDSYAGMQEIARTHRDGLRAVIVAESDFIEALGTLDSSHAEFVARLDEYSDYLEALLLWIPNHPPLWEVDPRVIPSELDELAGLVRQVPMTVTVWLVLGLGGAVVLLLVRPAARRDQARMNTRIARARDDSILPTLRALGTALLRALPVPVFLVAAATLFAAGATPLGASFASLLALSAGLTLLFGFLRILLEPGGIGVMHFGWRAEVVERHRHDVSWLLRWWLPLFVLALGLNRVTPDTGSAAVPRLVTLAAALLLVLRVVRRLTGAPAGGGARWYHGTWNQIRLVSASLFALIGAAAVFGLMFPVGVIADAIIASVWAGAALMLLHAVLTRALRVTRRRLRFRELMAARAATESPGDESGDIPKADLGDISAETLQLVNVGSVVAAAAALFVIWEPLLPAFDAFSRVTLWTSVSTVENETVLTEITLATLVTVSLLLGLTIFAARKIPALVELVLRGRAQMSAGARYATSTLINYAIVGTGTVAALSALGLQWSQLQWLVAALGVGIGFGLQEIIANFISGLIILFERPIRVGDVVTVGDSDGRVTRIRIRATTIQDWDGKELLVPNKEFITGRLLNWTLTDPVTRIVIPVGVAYGSDVEGAMKIMDETVRAHPDVLADPAPSIVFTGFGDNTLDLVARFFVPTMDKRVSTGTELHVAINAAMAAAGIEIAFPQRDVHLDTTAPLRVVMEDAREPA